MLIQFFSTLEELRYVIALGTWSSTPTPDSAGNMGLGCEEIAMLKAMLAQASWGFFFLSLGRQFPYVPL